jgi:hypothetical protein
MRAVIVVDGVVTNIVVVSDGWSEESAEWQPPDGSIAVLSDDAEVGDLYTDGKFHRLPVPEPFIVPQIISDRQFFQQLAMLGLITQAEALAAVKTGDLPAAFHDLLMALPSDQQFSALMLMSGAVSFARTHPLTVSFGQAFGWSDAQLDNLWIEASKL